MNQAGTSHPSLALTNLIWPGVSPSTRHLKATQSENNVNTPTCALSHAHTGAAHLLTPTNRLAYITHTAMHQHGLTLTLTTTRSCTCTLRHTCTHTGMHAQTHSRHKPSQNQNTLKPTLCMYMHSSRPLHNAHTTTHDIHPLSHLPCSPAHLTPTWTHSWTGRHTLASTCTYPDTLHTHYTPLHTCPNTQRHAASHCPSPLVHSNLL